MQNVTFKMSGKKLVIEVDLSVTPTVSSTGKSLIIGSTNGNVSLTVPPPVDAVVNGVKVGLSVYRKNPEYKGPEKE